MHSKMAKVADKLPHEVKSLTEIDKRGHWYKLNLPGSDQISPRLGHALIPGSDGKVTLIGGGHHEGAMSDVWLLDFSCPSEGGESVKKLPPIEGLKPKYEFLCTKIEDKIWMFGGADAKLTFNEVGYIEDGMWLESLSDSASGNRAPAPRTQGGNSALVEVQGKLYLCVFAGGQAGVDAVPDGNLYLYDIEEQVWNIVPVQSDIPPVTQGHIITSFGSKIFVHGGLNGSTLHKTLYMIDVADSQETNSSWTPVDIVGEIPSGRAAHGIAKGSGDSSKFYIFGGLGQRQSQGLNDLWQFDTLSNAWENISNAKYIQPSTRFGVAMCIITIKTNEEESANYLIIHGGMNSSGEVFNDLWSMKLED